MSRHALGAWEMFKACAHREVILMKRHSFTYKTRSVCHPEPDRNSYAVLTPRYDMSICCRAPSGKAPLLHA